MFDYIFEVAVRPIEAELGSDLVKPEMQGHLVKEKQVLRSISASLVTDSDFCRDECWVV